MLPDTNGQAAPAEALTPLLLTAREAAAALRVSERTLWSLTQRGEIPCVRLGRSVRYSRKALEAWIAEQKGQRLI